MAQRGVQDEVRRGQDIGEGHGVRFDLVNVNLITVYVIVIKFHGPFQSTEKSTANVIKHGRSQSDHTKQL